MLFSPRNLQGLFLAVTLLFAAALGWLGWRLLQQDRGLARQRRLEQLEAAAERVTAALYRRLAELEEALADPAHARIPAGAVLVRARPAGMEVRPPDGLLYYPVVPAAAAEAFRPLTRSTDPAVRAAALVRLGRNLRKCGRAPEALRVYEELAAMGTTPAGGLPAQLVALEARCTLFEELGRRADLEREARIFYEQLMRGHWGLRRAAHEFRVEQARGWLGTAPEQPQWKDKAALSAAADLLWNDWLRGPVSKGRRLLTMEGQPVLAAWASSPLELTALLAPAAVIEPALGEAGGFHAVLTDAEGRLLLGRAAPATAVRVERSPGSTRLPWALQVTAAGDGAAELAGRRWILAGGLALLVGLLVAVSYVVAHATGKELAVARLQADFVSAVSHEFRTPACPRSARWRNC